MKIRSTRLIVCLFFCFGLLGLHPSLSSAQDFQWPNGAKMALSLSFDDARASQVNGGTALLNEYGVKGTFYVVPNAVEQEIEGWIEAVGAGHEIGNHTMLHPCSGNFNWTVGKELENYDLERMRAELVEANNTIKALLGVVPVSFAYTCGESYVGRGVDTQSYVPLVSMLFESGRDWRNEMTNDPRKVDFAQVRGTEMDGKNFDEILPILETAKESGSWVALAGHEMNIDGNQTVRLSMLRDLIEYVQSSSDIWLATDGEVVAYVKKWREK